MLTRLMIGVTNTATNASSVCVSAERVTISTTVMTDQTIRYPMSRMIQMRRSLSYLVSRGLRRGPDAGGEVLCQVSWAYLRRHPVLGLRFQKPRRHRFVFFHWYSPLPMCS